MIPSPSARGMLSLTDSPLSCLFWTDSIMLCAGQVCAEEGSAAAEGCREDFADPDEEVPGTAALCTGSLHHLHYQTGGLGPRSHLPRAPVGTDCVPR